MAVIRTIALVLACATSAVFVAGTASAYVHSTLSTTDPTPIHWDLAELDTEVPEIEGGRLVFRLDAAGSADVNGGADLTALEAAFAAWEALPDSTVAFTRGPAPSGRRLGLDDELTIFWTESSPIVDQGTPDPGDDLDITGALAVTLTWWFQGGDDAAEIVEADIVFNGAEYEWTCDPTAEPGRFDIESVAVHEIGHALGLGHGAVGGATMFPRTAAGNVQPRTPAADDSAALAASYPAPGWAGATVRLSGDVRDGGGVAVVGAHVVAADGDGAVVAAAFTRADGSYELAGLPPGDLAVWVEPIDASDGRAWLFTSGSLPAYWRSRALDGDFGTTLPTTVTGEAGDASVLDLTVTRGAPAWDVALVGLGGSFGNRPIALEQGEKRALVGVAAPTGRLPRIGEPLSVSGTGVEVIEGATFPSFPGYDAIQIRIDLDADAAPGLRSLVVADGAGRTVAAGHFEVVAVPQPVDSDGDTITDTDEGDADPDGDFVANRFDLDSDGDTLPDALEAGDALLATPPVDTDGDATPDVLDLDSDADGLADAVEGAADQDGDGLGAFRDPDRDGGGEPDANEWAWGRDLDAASDDVTQPPGLVPGGSDGPPVVLVRVGALVALAFAPAARADVHRVRRGDLRELGLAPPAAVDCGVTGLTWAGAEVGDGLSTYYIVTGWNWRGEGSAGPGRTVAADCP